MVTFQATRNSCFHDFILTTYDLLAFQGSHESRLTNKQTNLRLNKYEHKLQYSTLVCVLITMCGITLRCLFISMYIFSPFVTGVCGASGEAVVYVGDVRKRTGSTSITYEFTGRELRVDCRSRPLSPVVTREFTSYELPGTHH